MPDDVNCLPGRNPVKAPTRPCPQLVKPDAPTGGRRQGFHRSLRDRSHPRHQLAAPDDIERLAGADPVEIPTCVTPELA
ncbi:MAG: hypothetical protein WBV80_26975 [Mycobacterium sp.]